MSNECFVQTEKPNSNTHNVLSVYVIPVVCIEDSGKCQEKSNSMAENQIELPHTGIVDNFVENLILYFISYFLRCEYYTKNQLYALPLLTNTLIWLTPSTSSNFIISSVQ